MGANLTGHHCQRSSSWFSIILPSQSNPARPHLQDPALRSKWLQVNKSQRSISTSKAENSTSFVTLSRGDKSFIAHNSIECYTGNTGDTISDPLDGFLKSYFCLLLPLVGLTGLSLTPLCKRAGSGLLPATSAQRVSDGELNLLAEDLQ